MRGKPGGNDDFAMAWPQRMEHPVDKAKQQQRPARLTRIFRHALQECAHFKIHAALPDNAVHHQARPVLPNQYPSHNGQQEKQTQRPQLHPAAR